ncbi:MAG: phosphatidylserine decarboxylase [Piscirickettsiaceae bacterium CG_4_9_14_3_um_filter_43_564]|nr:phosphatidylserine decarboxylase [Thiomicrospira sp.]OIP95228.1 MAG: phosphatidylserine decarboxylase [Thiomicrospira sp. CG2_30_44_34]PIQ03914.1 MAG: phosphatidylserine decarboxylase [Piscirickettsiaceae bacterium CG18_big_fil_WC_8_21_14_2_50_44_103]PIU38468.1 MAG: phosphatidylserine decarboxylase [Piscirickettsiaceae bacterium CG07_land_8_20_14_0_80_44_28]PIW57892.1 MAG: phosphatidylserine decarboxylase [Piscirickettsiaceae bacterium CG12_big_fil_rev_8_21_14_0_65_44_934]PIW77451.1 MAG: ph
MRFFDLLKVVPQYLIPKHLLSQAMHWFMQVETSWIKNTSIKLLTKLYKINISEADNEDLESYPHFNAFFTRALKAEARPIDDDPQNWCSPVDGVISQSHPINGNQLIQAKCHDYTLEALLGGDICYAQNFINGDAAVIYLSPKDYHRIHMPTDGQLLSMTYVPGDLFAVNPATVRSIPGLFARNERLIIRFSNDHGDFCLIMVGAIFVGSMETVWEGKITPEYGPTIRHWDYQSDNLHFQKGQELGRFNMGSTVVLLAPAEKIPGLGKIAQNTPIKMGAMLAQYSDNLTNN